MAGAGHLDAADIMSPASPITAPCAVCGGRTVLCCSGCEMVFYCSPACQQRDWREHRTYCRANAAKQQQQQQQKQQQSQQQRAAQSRGGSPTFSSQGGDEVALGSPSRSAAEGLAGGTQLTPAAALSLRDRRLHLRSQAVLNHGQGRYREALAKALEAYECAEATLKSVGTSAWEVNSPELEAAVLVELMIIVRSAYITEDFATGLGFLEIFCAAVDRLAGVKSSVPLFTPCAAATLLYTASEMSLLYGHEERAERYAKLYLAMARLAHGEGSPAVGDAYSFVAGTLTKLRRYDEALHFAMQQLEARKRSSTGGSTEKPLADAHWNVALLQTELNRSPEALKHLQEARDIHLKISGECPKTADVDVAASKLYAASGKLDEAITTLRSAVKTRQRSLGFASYETRQAAAQLAALETKVRLLTTGDEDAPRTKPAEPAVK